MFIVYASHWGTTCQDGGMTVKSSRYGHQHQHHVLHSSDSGVLSVSIAGSMVLCVGSSLIFQQPRSNVNGSSEMGYVGCLLQPAATEESVVFDFLRLVCAKYKLHNEPQSSTHYHGDVDQSSITAVLQLPSLYMWGIYSNDSPSPDLFPLLLHTCIVCMCCPAAKYASAFYGPFRDALQSAPVAGQTGRYIPPHKKEYQVR
jgi:hypothetical protein